jgi:hypothetical protein
MDSSRSSEDRGPSPVGHHPLVGPEKTIFENIIADRVENDPDANGV